MSIELLKKYNIKAKKSLGQNFLVNEDIIDEIVENINVGGENIVEVGPGYGALTEKLLERGPKCLTLVELDKFMVKILEDRIENGDFEIGKTNFEIKNIDVLRFIPKKKKYFVIANIPYYITSPILRHFLYKLEFSPEKMIILMQKDVGDKILDKKKSSVLSLMIAKKAKVEGRLFVSKNNFIPAPKVESSVLLFEKYDLYDKINDEKFLKIIKQAFIFPRKKLVKNLSNLYDKNLLQEKLKKIGFGENTRPEELNIKKWCEFIEELENSYKI